MEVCSSVENADGDEIRDDVKEEQSSETEGRLRGIKQKFV